MQGLNVAVGTRALYSNQPTLTTNGRLNTAVGSESLYSNTTGISNVAIGYRASYNSTAGSFIVALGTQALLNGTGNGNNAIGYQALIGITSGTYNNGLGYQTLQNTTAGNFNTAVGDWAGRGFANGNNNTFIGVEADANAAGYASSTALGALTFVTASNQVRIGAGATSIGGPQNWTNTSDGRFKFDVKEDIPGVSFIMKLRPVTYYMDEVALDKFVRKEQPELREGETRPQITNSMIRQTGFIAQEVEQAAKEMGFDFNGVDTPKNDGDYYGLRYAAFVVPMVKAMQEQQAIIETQEEKIARLEKENQQIKALLQQILDRLD
jgi:hypothetical protein